MSLIFHEIYINFCYIIFFFKRNIQIYKILSLINELLLKNPFVNLLKRGFRQQRAKILLGEFSNNLDECHNWSISLGERLKEKMLFLVS